MSAVPTGRGQSCGGGGRDVTGRNENLSEATGTASRLFAGQVAGSILRRDHLPPVSLSSILRRRPRNLSRSCFAVGAGLPFDGDVTPSPWPRQVLVTTCHVSTAFAGG